MENKIQIQLTQQDFNNISNISANHNLDYSLVEKTYQEMINKLYAQKKFKEFLEKAKVNLKK